MAKKKGKKVGGARPGSGPKVKVKCARTCAFVLDSDSFKFIDQYAKRKKVSRSEALRLIIAEYRKAGSKGKK